MALTTLEDLMEGMVSRQVVSTATAGLQGERSIVNNVA